ncbi:MAG: hypothetical protein RL497_2166 [Pseudomonadota bacterium]|jgi:GTPase
MNIKKTIFLILCATNSLAFGQEFELKIDRIDELHGFVLKGLSISGKIKTGCITNENEFALMRNKTLILNETAKLLTVRDLKPTQTFNGEAYKGEYVTLYLPDRKKDEVQLGDVVRSSTASCPQGPTRK